MRKRSGPRSDPEVLSDCTPGNSWKVLKFNFCPGTGWLLNLENLKIRPGGLVTLEKQVFFSGTP